MYFKVPKNLKKLLWKYKFFNLTLTFTLMNYI